MTSVKLTSDGFLEEGLSAVKPNKTHSRPGEEQVKPA
jgi:hypothetical protein